MKLITLPKISVIFTETAMADIRAIVNSTAYEVGFFGKVKETEPYNYQITDIYLPYQEVDHTVCLVQPDGMMRFAEEVGDTSEWLFWGHSHVNMGVTPSAKDDETALDYEGIPYLIRGIFNKQGAIRVDLFHFKDGIIYEHEEISVRREEKTSRKWVELIKERLTLPKPYLPYAHKRKRSVNEILRDISLIRGYNPKDDFKEEGDDIDEYSTY